jgi:hypothetical protein
MPDDLQRTLSLKADAASRAIGEYGSIHRTLRGTGDRFDLQSRFFE